MHPAPESSEPRGLSPSGFSLVEMMVVLFLMGLLAATVVISMPGDERALRVEAEKFAARTVAARDEAITGAVPVALVVSDAGYYFEKRADGQWQPFAEGRLGLTGWAEGTTASLAGTTATNAAPEPGATATPAGRSRIVFDSVGLASGDATVRLAHGSSMLGVRIARDGKVRLDAAK